MKQFLKSYLRSTWSDLVFWCSLGNLLNELFIAQKSLIHRLVVTLLVTQAVPVFDKLPVSFVSLGCRVSQLSQN